MAKYHPEQRRSRGSCTTPKEEDLSDDVRGRAVNLIWNMARDLIGLHGDINGLLLEAEVAPNEHEGSADTKPEQDDRQDGGDGGRCGGALLINCPIDAQENGANDSRIERCSEEGTLLPFLAMEQLVDSGGPITSQ